MKRIKLVAKVGQLISLADYGISMEQVHGVHTVFNYELAMKLLSGKISVSSLELGEGNGTLQEVAPNIKLDAQNRLHYFSLIPRKSDAVLVIIEYTETKEIMHVGSKIIALDESQPLVCEAVYPEGMLVSFDFQAQYLVPAGVDGYGNKVYGNRGFRLKDRHTIWDFA